MASRTSARRRPDAGRGHGTMTGNDRVAAVAALAALPGAAPSGSPRPVILDCDPGHDDALAIVLALASPELDVRGITTVGGNAGVANTTRNALRVLTLLERPDVPV